MHRAIAAVLADTDVAARAKDFARLVAGHPGLEDAVALVEDLRRP
jgi:hypothetical protein